MNLEICIGMLIFGWFFLMVFGGTMLSCYSCMTRGEKQGAVICTSICLCVALIGSTGGVLYGVAAEQIEYKLLLSPHSVEGVQYIQWIDPDTHDPVIKNINEKFERQFHKRDLIEVIIYKEGPYNGIYNRPPPKISWPEDVRGFNNTPPIIIIEEDCHPIGNKPPC